MNKFLLSAIMILLLTDHTNAEVVTLKTGESIKGKIIEQTDHYIQMQIDIKSRKLPYTYYFDEIASIDDKSINVTLSSPVIQQEKNKPFTDEDYGFQITFPEGWHVVVGQNRIKQRIKDIKRWQNIKASQFSECDPGTVKFAKKIANVIAEEISLAMTPYFAAYEEEPKNFYRERRPIPEIIMEIREIKKDDPLLEEKNKIEMMLPFLDGEFINPPEFVDINGAKTLRYTVRYEEDENVGEVVKSVYKIVQYQREYSLELLTKYEGFEDDALQFNNVVNSITWIKN